MKKCVYVVRDDLRGYVGPLTQADNDAIAMRDFAVAIQADNGVLGRRRGDFRLYSVGEFDLESGQFVPSEPRLVCEGLSITGGVVDG